jgi:hypothetical protein
MEDCCCRIPAGYPGAEGGLFLLASQDLIDNCCPESLLANQELMEDCCCRILVGNGNQGADGGTIVA